MVDPRRKNKDILFNKKAASIANMIDNEAPEREYIVDGFIPKDTICIIAGPGGCSKSFMSLTLGMNLTTRTPFLDHFENNKKLRTLIISAEDTFSEVHRRVQNILTDISKNKTDQQVKKLKDKLKKRLYIVFTQPEPDYVLYSENGESDAANRIIRFCTKELKYTPDLIILDNLTCLHDADHSAPEAATGTIKALRKIQEKTGATILLLAHTNKSSQFGDLESRLNATSVLGSTSFVNNARLVITMTQVLKSDKLPGNLDHSNLVAMKFSKTNFGQVNTDTMFLYRDPETGVLKYLDLPKKDPNEELAQIAAIVSKNPELNKTQLTKAARDELRLGKTASVNLIDRTLKNKIIVQEETGRNNSKIFRITEKGEKLMAEYKDKELEISNQLEVDKAA